MKCDAQRMRKLVGRYFRDSGAAYIGAWAAMKALYTGARVLHKAWPNVSSRLTASESAAWRVGLGLFYRGGPRGRHVGREGGPPEFNPVSSAE